MESLFFVASAAALILARCVMENVPESVLQSRPAFASQCGHATESGLISRMGGMEFFGIRLVQFCLVRRGTFFVAQFPGLRKKAAKERCGVDSTLTIVKRDDDAVAQPLRINDTGIGRGLHFRMI